MKAQNIMAQSLFTPSNGIVNSSVTSKKDDTFELMMNDSLGDKLSSKNVQDNSNNQPNGKSDVKSVKKPETIKKSPAMNNQTGRVKDKEDYGRLESKVKMKTMDKGIDEEEMSSIIAEILPWLQQVQMVVAESLGLSTEELEGILEAQGKTIFDLLDTETLKEMVLSINQESDIASVLTNENLAKQMEDLLQSVQQMKESSELPIDRLKLSAEEDQEFAQKLTELINKALNLQKDDVQNDKKDDLATGSSDANKEIIVINEKSSYVDENLSESNYSNLATANSDLLDGNSNDKKETTDMDLSQGFQAFTDQLVNTVERYSVDFDGSLVQTSEIRDIANQIIESIKFTVKPGQTSMEMQLNPESLGKVNFSVQAKNGVMSAQFIVENHLTKEAIESHLTILRDALDQQGIKVEVIEVTVSEFSFTQNNQANSEGHMQEQSSGNRNNISIRNKITLEEAIAIDDADDDNVDSVDQMAELRGNQVDYIA